MSTRINTMKYAKLLELSKEAMEAVKRPFNVKRMSKKSISFINDLEEEEAVAQEKYRQELTKYPLDFEKLMVYKNQVAMSQRRQAQMKEIRKELF